MHTVRSRACVVLATTLAVFAACSKKAPADPNNRRIEWRYGPTTDASSREHLVATGTKGGAKLTQGWQCHLQDGKRLKVVPYELSAAHPLFGKVALNVGFFDKAEQPIGEQMSPVLQAGNASFTLELDEKVAARLVDVVFWYVAI
ncbi:MAG: hypothetical protein U1F60_09745 [Planctomycetota bacterium]